MLKRCGLDAVFFYGLAKRPVYLYLDADTVEIKDAENLWGRDIIETEKHLKEIHGKNAQVACIGPAGEKQSLLAGVANDGGRYAARSGLGAVMGAKRLKAVVAYGKKRVGVVDKPRIKELSQGFRQELQTGSKGIRRLLGDRLLGFTGWFTRKSPVYTRQPAELFRQILSKFGTSGLTALSAESGDSPIKNWGGVGFLDFPMKRSQKIGAEAVIRHETKKYGCYSCPLRCGGIVQVNTGPDSTIEMHKPEYETICAFGALLLNEDLNAIFRINDLVNRGGLDSISCGAVVAFAIECYENGILTRDDTDGLDLTWGNASAIIGLTEMIIQREGLGDILADGVKVAAEKIGRGAEQYAVHCGGVEPPMHDPKFDPGFGPIYHCESAPGRHTTASYQYLDLMRLEKQFKRAKKIPGLTTRKQRHAYDHTGEALAVNCYYKMLIDGAGACLFGASVDGPLPLCDWINAAAGWNFTPDQYLEIGERIQQLRHAFNIREGLNPYQDFRPHPRIYGQPPLTRGPAKDITIDIDTMARSFYDAQHWDLETGKPDLGHLQTLGLFEIIEAFYPDANRSEDY